MDSSHPNHWGEYTILQWILENMPHVMEYSQREFGKFSEVS